MYRFFLSILILFNTASAFEREESYLELPNQHKTSNIRCCYYQSWEKSSTLVLYLQGLQSFVEKNEETINDLCRSGCDVFTFDWRSQGKSSRFLTAPSDRQKVHVPSFDIFLDDLSFIVDHVYKKYPHKNTFFMGISMGGHLALRYFQERWVHTQHPVSGIILVGPLVDLYTYNCPYGLAYGIFWLASNIANYNESYVLGARNYDFNKTKNSASTSTHCPKRAQNNHTTSIQNPDCVTGGPTWYFMKEMIYSLSLYHVPSMPQNIPQSLWLIAGEDGMVNNYRIKDFIPNNGKRVELAHSYHNILNETDDIRNEVLSKINDFIFTKP